MEIHCITEHRSTLKFEKSRADWINAGGGLDGVGRANNNNVSNANNVNGVASANNLKTYGLYDFAERQKNTLISDL